MLLRCASNKLAHACSRMGQRFDGMFARSIRAGLPERWNCRTKEQSTYRDTCRPMGDQSLSAMGLWTRGSHVPSQPGVDMTEALSH